MEDTIKSLQEKIKTYEQNGAAKLYYALNRKMNEMADLLNDNSLTDVNLDDPKDKSFDRVFKILEKSETVSNSATSLKLFAGISGNEEADISKKPFVDTIAQSRK
jgi:hypothetical protein